MNLDLVTGVEKRVCHDIAARQQLGIKKYGQTVADAGLNHVEWLQHAYLEVLDQAVYLKSAIEELQALPDKATKDLFTDGSGYECERLRLIGPAGENLGGLSFAAVKDRLRKWLNLP